MNRVEHQGHASPPTEKLDEVLALVRRSLRFSWIVILAALLGGASAAGAGILIGRSYDSQAVILYRELIPTRLLQGPGAPAGNRDLSSQYKEMLLSRPLIKGIMEEMDLYREVRDERGTAAAIEEMRHAIQFRSRGGGTFHLTYRGRSPDEAQSVLEALVEALIDRARHAQLEGVEATREFLDQERLRFEDVLHEKERALAIFLSEHPEFAFDNQAGLAGAAGASVRARNKEKEVVERDLRLEALERQRKRLRARLEGKPVASGEGSAELVRAQESLQRARRKRNEARDRIEELETRFTDRHPDVLAAQSSLERAERNMEMAEKTVKAMSQADQRKREPVSDEERSEIERELGKLDAAMRSYRSTRKSREKPSAAENEVVELEAEWARLYREVNDVRDRYEALEAKAFTAEIVAASEAAGRGSQLSILDPPSLPARPAGIPLRFLAFAGVFVFGGLASLLAVGLAMTDDRISDGRDFGRLGLPDAIAVVAAGRARRRWRRG